MSYLHEYVATPGLGAMDHCSLCYEAKSTAYRACQQLRAGSAARETCFRAADAAFGACLDECGGKQKTSAGPLLLLGAGAAALYFLS